MPQGELRVSVREFSKFRLKKVQGETIWALKVWGLWQFGNVRLRRGREGLLPPLMRDWSLAKVRVVAEMNREQQPLFRRRRQLPTSLIYDRLPGYMKPTFGSSQKALLNRSRTSSLSATVTSRPQSSPVTLSSSLNLQQVSLLGLGSLTGIGSTFSVFSWHLLA